MPLPVGTGGTGNVVQPLIGGGVIPVRALTMQFRDSSAYTLVAAGSVTANTRMLLELSELYNALTPSVTTYTGDLFRNSLGTDNVLNFVGNSFVELVSDGISEWAVNERAQNGAQATNFITSVAGRTGAIVLTSADVGLGNVADFDLSNVNNTSDVDKPVSTATQDAIDEAVVLLTSADVGLENVANIDLSNVNNTSDVDKPISDAVAAVLIPNTVIPHTVSGTLTAGGAINQIRDSGTFTLPLANSVPADTYLVAELPKRYRASTPVINSDGDDTITDDDGPDDSIGFVGSAKLTLTSDGVSNWSL
jgi:hypothetical protein